LVGGIQDKRSSQGEWKYMAAYLEDRSSQRSPGPSLGSVGTQTFRVMGYVSLFRMPRR
jgi:hypothetical protein